LIRVKAAGQAETQFLKSILEAFGKKESAWFCSKITDYMF
jgi:hypothetical protein